MYIRVNKLSENIDVIKAALGETEATQVLANIEYSVDQTSKGLTVQVRGTSDSDASDLEIQFWVEGTQYSGLGFTLREAFRVDNVGLTLLILFIILVSCCGCFLIGKCNVKRMTRMSGVRPMELAELDSDDDHTANSGLQMLVTPSPVETRKNYDFDSVPEGKSSFQMETMALQEFKQKLHKKCNLTPEAFFRSCDTGY